VRRIGEIEEEIKREDFWEDPRRAQERLKELSSLKRPIERWEELKRKVEESIELCELAIKEGDFSLRDDIARELEPVEEEISNFELELLFRDEYDRRNALLSIHSGAGGTESQDWAQMLMRMYMRWAERKGFSVEVIDISEGEEAGIKSATLLVKGEYAYGYLKAERGVHRLVRISPFDADHARHTSFALVDVIPEIESEREVEINPDELKIEFFGASGPGGQHLQKTSTAVRITHIPTGITATCQSERSQARNKEMAMKVLKSRLLALKEKERREEIERIRGERKEAAWGNQIRSYILHPYKLVKDHRTGYETSDAMDVLDGNIDEFIKEYFKK